MARASTELIDVSFAGSKIKIAGVDVDDFMDDANPIEIQDTEVSSVGVNCNGCMIRNAKPNVIMLSVTVIPGSKTDSDLYKLFKKYRVQDGNNKAKEWAKALDATITLGNGTLKKTTYQFGGGTFVSGPPGPVSSAEGKLQGRTYTFAFAAITG